MFILLSSRYIICLYFGLLELHYTPYTLISSTTVKPLTDEVNDIDHDHSTMKNLGAGIQVDVL